MWSFNRLKDASKIEVKEMEWQGPFSWVGYETLAPARFIIAWYIKFRSLFATRMDYLR